jgi:hypothetical protein
MGNGNERWGDFLWFASWFLSLTQRDMDFIQKDSNVYDHFRKSHGAFCVLEGFHLLTDLLPFVFARIDWVRWTACASLFLPSHFASYIFPSPGGFPFMDWNGSSLLKLEMYFMQQVYNVEIGKTDLRLFLFSIFRLSISTLLSILYLPKNWLTEDGAWGAGGEKWG